MAMGMSSIIAKPSACDGLHVISSASAASKKPSLASKPSFHPLRSVNHQHGFYHYNLSFMKQDQRKLPMSMSISCSSQPIPPPAAPSSSFPGLPGKGWLIGIALSFFLPFMTNKWGPLLLLKKEVDSTLEKVEQTVEVLEKVVEEVEKVAEEVEAQLPEGQLKNAVAMLEHAAEQADKTAHLVDDTIHRVEKLEEEIESRVESELAKAKQKQTNEVAKTAKGGTSIIRKGGNQEKEI
ncbi:hypothetical protein BVRB_1g008360 isoform A [Beta vulgaris subsp. vulgaris]|uniref:uncharacterized protein LOC104891639 isoform X2 n=1 Tax=Beta vulgaris subsp. vulgaris TaxID=3555 RepID=UPI00053FFED3|nr:uncharacterized protein LOC104891639 isoform X2 [Beta vulgaris subsp. vulgaris]KMT19780.1 hypothetical protein BVRB_1g008360 isoform A [Beta vulgaris subsp. vulgaris]